MNDIIRDLMRRPRFIEEVRLGLPAAFQKAEVAHRRPRSNVTGQEVGITRESIMLALLRHQLGDSQIEFPDGQTSQQDVLIGGRPLEVKTVTGNGQVTAVWTVDNESVRDAIDRFRFESDMLVARIFWGKEAESLFYIPSEVLSSVAGDNPDFLRSATGTNNRGIKFPHRFMLAAQQHPDSESISINWQRLDYPFPTPLDLWQNFWLNREYLRYLPSP